MTTRRPHIVSTIARGGFLYATAAVVLCVAGGCAPGLPSHETVDLTTALPVGQRTPEGAFAYARDAVVKWCRSHHIDDRVILTSVLVRGMADDLLAGKCRATYSFSQPAAKLSGASWWFSVGADLRRGRLTGMAASSSSWHPGHGELKGYPKRWVPLRRAVELANSAAKKLGIHDRLYFEARAEVFGDFKGAGWARGGWLISSVTLDGYPSGAEYGFRISADGSLHDACIFRPSDTSGWYPGHRISGPRATEMPKRKGYDPGKFNVNITVLGPTQQQVVDFARSARRKAYVSPTRDGMTVLYDAQCDKQDENVIGKLTAQISSRFHCPALAVLNYDDDQLWYRLYSDGKPVDEYNSCPAALDDSASDAPVGGNAALLCATFGKPGMTKRVQRILATPDYTSAGERHEVLAEVLGLPPWAVGIGYGYLSSGDVSSEVDIRQFVKVGG